MGSGTTSYFGYEYQFCVSVWLMLLSHKTPGSYFARISIETLFGQDAEIISGNIPPAHLPLDSYEENLELVQEIGKYSVQIQVKTRGRERQWSPGDIRDVLLKKDESKPEAEALTVLEKLVHFPNEIFVFITNGTVSTNLTELLSDVSRLIQTNEFHREITEQMATDVKRTLLSRESDKTRRDLLEAYLTPEVVSRIHIFEGPDIDDLKLKIETILEREYRILPYTRAHDFSKQLLERVRNGALGNRRDITTEELTGIVGHTSPQLPYAETEAIFQETQAYKQALDKLNRQHLVVLSGEPGVGKTAIAQKLINHFHLRGFDSDLITGDVLRNVYRACKEPLPIILIVDDPFGEITFNGETSIGNSFNDLVVQLQAANGNVKLVMTTRRNLLAEIVERTSLNRHTLNDFLVNVPEPSTNLQEAVLRVFLDHFQLTAEKITTILSAFDWQQIPFEDLLHVHDFANEASRVYEDSDQLTTILETSRPSQYKKWISLQPPRIQLYLLVLWLLTEVDQVATREEIQGIYTHLANTPKCAEILNYDASGFNFYSAQSTLLSQERVRSDPRGNYDFIHPKLKAATREYFDQRTEFIDLTLAIIQTFRHILQPLEQSVAAMLLVSYHDRLDPPLDTLQEICNSRFLKARDTVIRFGVHLLHHANEEVRQLMDYFYSIRYGPDSNCELDNDGNLVVIDDFLAVSSIKEILDRRIRNNELFSELEPIFDRVASGDKNLFDLNPIERYWLVRWLTQINRPVSNDRLLDYLSQMALDHTSFVRYTVAAQLGQTELIQIDGIESILKTLCYDSSPHVKIDILEHAIMPNWSDFPEPKQQEMLGLVINMLDDPVFRRRVARGLVDQSGTLWFYHEKHTDEQKREWFEAVALKLLTYEFGYRDDFDRFLAAFEKHAESLATPFRIPLLQAITEFVDRNPYYASEVTYTIYRRALSNSTTPEEHSLLLKLIQRLPAYSKAELSFDFARIFDRLPDDRYQEFVHRLFYIENTDEFIIERTASLLGFLDNPNAILNNLPQPMSQMGDDVSSAITNYIETQTEDFKLALIFHVFGHGLYAQTSARSSRLHSHPIIEELIERELNYAPGSRGNILISDVILRSGYTNAFWGNEETRMSKEKLFKYLEAILDSENPSLGKAVCNIIFASNIVSAVHKHHDWLIIVRRLVTHSNPEVQEYAIALFNRHFHHVWEDLLLSRDNEVIKNWFSEEALQEFFEESEPFMMAVNLLKLSHGWERYTEHQKQVTLEIIHELALLPDFHSKWLAFRFINRMDDRLIDSEQEKLYRAIFGDEEHRWETNIPGREEQLERDFALDEYLPKFDWSKYS